MSKKRPKATGTQSTYAKGSKPAQRSTYLVKVEAKAQARRGAKRRGK